MSKKLTAEEKTPLQKNDIAREIIQEWIKEKQYVVSFDGEIIIGIDKTLHANELISLFESYHQARVKEKRSEVAGRLCKVEEQAERCLGDRNLLEAYARNRARIDELKHVLKIIGNTNQ